jgi:Fe-S cluster assembly protein SufD
VKPSPAGAVGTLLAGLGGRRLVIVDGAFSPALSDLSQLEAGLVVRSTAEALAADEPLLAGGAPDPAGALNAAFAADGFDLAIAPDAAIRRPIHLAFVTTAGPAAATFTRSRITVGARAKATFIETHEGPDGSDHQVSAAFDLTVGEGASVDHVRVVGEGDQALHVALLSATLAKGAVLRQFGLGVGGALARNQISVDIEGEGAVYEFREARLLAGAQHADTTLAVRHAAVGSRSRELFKAVVDGSARAVFQGRITVEPGAQQTDGRMMARALLLSDEAVANCKPELEIFADDVQCGHGATIGGLDEQLRFYLMARGIPAAEADALLIRAFIGEVLDAIPGEDLRDALTAMASDWLERRR